MMRLALALAAAPAVALNASSAASSAQEYVAFVPESGLVTWQEVTYPSNLSATSASEVSLSDVGGSPDALGAWADDLDLGGTPMLTARAHGDVLYAQINTGRAPSGDPYVSKYFIYYKKKGGILKKRRAEKKERERGAA